MNLPPPPLTVPEVAGYLGVGDDVVRDLLRRKALRGEKVGGQWRVLPKDLAEYMLETFEKP